MSLPKQVQKQSEDVQALYKELNKETAEATAGLDSGEKVPEEKQAETTTEVPVEENPTATSDSVENKQLSLRLKSTAQQTQKKKKIHGNKSIKHYKACIIKKFQA